MSKPFQFEDDYDDMRPYVAVTVDVARALALLFKFKSIDGAHHKDWLLDQITHALCSDKYSEFVAYYRKDEDDSYAYEWDEGIPP